MASEIVIAQTSIDDETRAQALVQGAVEARLAACCHVDGPFSATYWWQGKIEKAQEWRLSFKTTASRLPELEAWVAREHPYEVPEWVTVPVTGGSEAYLKWVVEETTPR